MKVPKSYEGKYVFVQLGTNVCMASYGGHVNRRGDERLMPAPITKTVATPEGDRQSPMMSNLLVGARVVEVHDDCVEFELLDPDPDGKTGTVVHKLVPSMLIVSLDTVSQVSEPMPIVTQRVHAEPSRIIQP